MPLFCLVLAAAPSRAAADPAPITDEQGLRRDARTERVATEIELAIESVVPRGRFAGTAIVATADPRFVLVGTVAWVQRPEVVPLRSRQAFAIHSPTRLGLGGWRRGDRICLLLTRVIRDGRTQWELAAMVPDAGCRGGG